MEKSKLLELLKFHDEEHRKIDEQLAIQCKYEIESMINRKDFQGAKNYVKGFYEGYGDLSFEKDLIIARINRMLIDNGEKLI